MNVSEPERLPLPPWLLTLLAVVSLSICGVYGSASVLWQPTAGFLINTSDWRVVYVYPEVAERGTIQVGDTLLQIGDMSREQYRATRTTGPFIGTGPGDVVTLLRERDGVVTEIAWVMPPVITRALLLRLLVNGPAVLFALSGLLIQVGLRPRNQPWLLMLGVCYLMAMWLVLGVTSSTGFGGASLGLHAVTWLLAAVMLDLHLTVPVEVWGQRRARGRAILYGVAAFAAVLELLGYLPSWAYDVPLLLAVAVPGVLLVKHWVARGAPATRRAAGLMLAGIGLALGPGMLLSIVPNLLQQNGGPPITAYVSLFAVPLLPAFYTYALYKRYLGDLEFRANRLLTSYLFGLLLFLVLVGVAVLLEGRFPSVDEQQAIHPIIVITVGLLTGLGVGVGFRPFQRAVERRLLGVPAAPTHLLVAHASRIATCHDEAALVRLLRDEVLPGVLVRQSALLTQDNQGQWRVVYAAALPEGGTAGLATAAPALLADAGRYRPPAADAPQGWVRLALPLRAVAQPPGLWLLGRRDPDDFYAAAELPVLQALADHLAVALVNIRQTQLLRTLYQANVNRTESERLNLARELHDGPLNEFGLLAQKVVGEQITPDFRPTYTAAVARLRHTIAGLRPVMLNYGLATGLRSLVSELAEQWPNGPAVELAADGDGCRYPEEVETHAYRIVQQACQNALRHAQARAIRLAGTLTPQRLDLVVEDDGRGFEAGPDLTQWLERHHFGLASMHERAALIGGALQIESAPGHGTRLRLMWPAAEQDGGQPRP